VRHAEPLLTLPGFQRHPRSADWTVIHRRGTQTHEWLNLAGLQGSRIAPATQCVVERKTTRDQLAQVQRLAHEWLRAFESRTEGQYLGM